jgi:hypothetical protein
MMIKPLHKFHVFEHLEPRINCMNCVVVGDQLVNGFDVFRSHFLQHHVELHSLVASSDDQSEQDVYHEDEASKVATWQGNHATAERDVAGRYL